MIALNLVCLLVYVVVASADGGLHERIVGGQGAQPGQFPHMVGLRLRQNNQHLCGASLLGNAWFLSAAHCTFGAQLTAIIGWVGAHTRNDGIAHQIAQIINHPQFGSKWFLIRRYLSF